MDLNVDVIDERPSAAERATIDAVLGDLPLVLDADANGTGILPPGSPQAKLQRSRLLPALHAVQARTGWISPAAVRYLSERLGVPRAEIFGVASFYALFAMEPRPPVVVHVCDDLACLAAGADRQCAR